MNPCAECSIRNTAICQALTDDELDQLSRVGRHQTIERGKTVIWEGDESLMVGNVIDGVLKLTSATSDGREQTLGILFPSDFMGRPFGATAGHSVIALTDSRICTFPRSSFDEFAHEHPELEHRLLQHTLTELDRARQWMLLLGRKGATERVATFLVAMADRICGGRKTASGSIEVPLAFGRQDMADLLGLTIETVSRQLTRLRDENVIRTPDRRTVEILDLPALESYAEGE